MICPSTGRRKDGLVSSLIHFPHSEETQMDPYNIAICFGPNLCPIPEGKDLVLHTNLVNDLIKNFIIFCDDIFNFEIDGPVYFNVE